jgi:hypothetical protein
VFDLWVQQWRLRQARGEVIVVRYADDLVLGFQHESDVARFRADLRQRFERFGLELHPDKTRHLRFGPFAEERRRERGQERPEVFEFLGFTHICGKTKSGKFLLYRHTSKSRMRAKLKAIREELLRRRHLPVPDQGRWIGAVVRGYFAYHAIPTNSRIISSFRVEVIRYWLHALRRRSQRSRMTWDRMRRLSNHQARGRTSAEWPSPKKPTSYGLPRSPPIEHMHKLVARSQNALRGRWENLWSTEQTCVVKLVGREAVMDKLVYTANSSQHGCRRVMRSIGFATERMWGLGAWGGF